LPDASSSAGETISITDANFEQSLAMAGDRPLLIDCWAAWCGPCRMLTPTIDQLARESQGRWVIGKLNVDENPRTASRFNISSIPAMLIFRNGELRDQLVGLQPKQAIEARLAAIR
jgi:thioredoxin 1